MSMIAGEGEIPVRGDFTEFEQEAKKAGEKVTRALSKDVNDGLRKDKEFSRSGEKIGQDIGDGANRRVSGAFKKIAGLAAGLLVVNQVGQAIGDAFAEAQEAGKITRLTEQVIKTTGGAAKITAKQVGDLAESISNVSAVDDEIIQSGANLLLTFKNVRNEAGKGNDVFNQTVGLANDMSIALGQDMKSSSIQLGKALNDPVKGVTALQRVGVSFTESQRDQIKVLTESGDILGAQKTILKEVGDQFGGAAKAAADPVAQLKVTWGNLLEDLGTRALPIVNEIAGQLGKRLPGLLDGLGTAFSNIGKFLSPVVEGIQSFVYTLTSGFTEDEGTPLEMVALRVRDAFAGIATVGREVIGFLTGTVVPGLKKAFGDIAEGFFASDFGGETGGVFGTIGLRAREAYDFITGVALPGIRRAFDSFIAGFRGQGGAGSIFTDLGEAARGAWKIFNEELLPILKAVGSFIGNNLKPILIGLGIPLFLLGGWVVVAYQKFELFRDVVETAVGVAKTIITTAVDAIAASLNFLGPVIANVASWIRDDLMPVAVAGFRVIAEAARWLYDTVLHPIFTGVSAVIRNVVVPALTFLKDVAVNFVFPLIMGIVTDAGEVLGHVFRAIRWVIDNHLAPGFAVITDAVSTMWRNVQPILDLAIGFIQTKLVPVWDGIKLAAAAAFDALPGIIRAALRAVGSVLSGFLNGAASIADAVGLNNIAKPLRDAAGTVSKWGAEPVPTNSIRDNAAGGRIPYRARGGPIPGNHNRDDVPIFATPGEWVIKKASVKQYERRYGAGFMEAFNAGHFALGGLIPDFDDIRGLADGMVDKARGLGTAALERVWPALSVAPNMTGIPAGGVNHLRKFIFDKIRGDEAASAMAGGGFSRSGGGGPAGRYTEGMLKARAAILAQFGPMAVGGYANRNVAGTSSKSAHAMWRAWDFMVGLGNVAKGNAIARFLIANAGQYGLKSLIWNAQSNSGGGWRPYSHPGGYRDATSQHLDHVHAEFFRKGGLVGPTVHKMPWDSGGTAAPGWNLINNTTGGPEVLRPDTGARQVFGDVYVSDPTTADEMLRRAEFHLTAGGFG
jgi:phage-related protein